MTSIHTYLPIFTGFYNTIFSEYERYIECELDDEESFRENYPELNVIPWDYIQDNFYNYVDDEDARTEQVEYLCSHLPDFYDTDGCSKIVLGCELESLKSPREYNFANDSANVKINVDIEELKRYLNIHEDRFEKYLQVNYTPCDGYIPHYPNTVGEWAAVTKGYTVLAGHYLGSILQFVAENEGLDAWDLYQDSDCYEGYINHVNIEVKKMLADYLEI